MHIPGRCCPKYIIWTYVKNNEKLSQYNVVVVKFKFCYVSILRTQTLKQRII